MGALENANKSNSTKENFQNFWAGVKELAGIIFGENEAEYDGSEESIDQAIKETKKESKGNAKELSELDKVGQKLKENMARFQYEIEGTEETKTDGFNNLPNKLEGIEASVSEIKAVEMESKSKNKGGKSKTRVEEE